VIGGAGGAAPTGRRRGVVREALAAWARQWADEQQPGGLTLVDLVGLVPGLAGRSAADRRMLQNTVGNMVQAGELVRLGLVNRPGHRGKPLRLYAPPPLASGGSQAEAVALLAGVAGAWGRSVQSDAAGAATCHDLPNPVLPGVVGQRPGGADPGTVQKLHSVVSGADQTALNAVSGGAATDDAAAPAVGRKWTKTP